MTIKNLKMKLFEASDDQKTVRLGIVKLGTAVGKVRQTEYFVLFCLSDIYMLIAQTLIRIL